MSPEFFQLNISFNDMHDRIEVEYHYLVSEICVDGDMLYTGWVKHMCRLLWPTLTDDDINCFIQEIGWH